MSLVGRVYNWRATRTPERDTIHTYHTSLVDKIYLCTKPNPQTGTPVQVHLTFEHALERIARIDALTRGIPKIFYLVGWQFDGHDSKYPAWSEVNPHLARPTDRTPADSLRWLMRAARRYNSTVSLHLNMMDAYENSPLWETYSRAKLIVGKGGVWGGEQAYLVDYRKEWDLGLAQKRIDDLCRVLPLVDAGTVHIDAFWPTGNDPDGQLETMRRIVRHWRNKGIDVTTEGLVTPNLNRGLIGLVPMVWHINYDLWKKPDEFTENDYMEIPASLFCGGRDHSYRSLIFGTSMQGEGIPDDQPETYLANFCLETLPWQYLNRFERQGIFRDGSIVQVEYADDLVVRADLERQTTAIHHQEVLLRDGDDVFIPAAWQNTPEIIAFSKDGYLARSWRLPESWRGHPEIAVRLISEHGLGEPVHIPIIEGQVELSLEKGHAVSLALS
jgi:hypothetical protein